MPKDQASTPGAAGPAAMVQQNFDQLARASERFMKGVVDASVQQIELSRSLMEGGLEDFRTLAKARDPEAFMQAEFDVLRRRSERMIAVMQKVSEDLSETWGKAIEISAPSSLTPTPKSPSA